MREMNVQYTIREHRDDAAQLCQLCTATSVLSSESLPHRERSAADGLYVFTCLFFSVARPRTGPRNVVPLSREQCDCDHRRCQLLSHLAAFVQEWEGLKVVWFIINYVCQL